MGERMGSEGGFWGGMMGVQSTMYQVPSTKKGEVGVWKLEIRGKKQESRNKIGSVKRLMFC